MREIKFRGFTKDEATPQKNKWVFGDFYRKGNNSLVGDEETIFIIRENNYFILVFDATNTAFIA